MKVIMYLGICESGGGRARRITPNVYKGAKDDSSRCRNLEVLLDKHGLSRQSDSAEIKARSCPPPRPAPPRPAPPPNPVACALSEMDQKWIHD